MDTSISSRYVRRDHSIWPSIKAIRTQFFGLIFAIQFRYFFAFLNDQFSLFLSFFLFLSRRFFRSRWSDFVIWISFFFFLLLLLRPFCWPFRLQFPFQFDGSIRRFPNPFFLWSVLIASILISGPFSFINAEFSFNFDTVNNTNDFKVILGHFPVIFWSFLRYFWINFRSILGNFFRPIFWDPFSE